MINWETDILKLNLSWFRGYDRTMLSLIVIEIAFSSSLNMKNMEYFMVEGYIKSNQKGKSTSWSLKFMMVKQTPIIIMKQA